MKGSWLVWSSEASLSIVGVFLGVVMETSFHIFVIPGYVPGSGVRCDNNNSLLIKSLLS